LLVRLDYITPKTIADNAEPNRSNEINITQFLLVPQ